MNEGRATLVRFRLERARETFAEAEMLAHPGHWNGCLNRLYYACFYAVNALLLSQGLSSAKHAGVRDLFNKHFVRTGAVSQEGGEFYNELFRSRLRGDYDEVTRFDEPTVRPWIDRARGFVSEIERLLGSI